MVTLHSFYNDNTMKTFEELKYRFEFLASVLRSKGMVVDKLCLEPPVSETELDKYEKKWNKKLPDEMRRFFLEVAGKIIFQWGDENVDTRNNSILIRGLFKNTTHDFNHPHYKWPHSCGFEWSLKQMDWIYEAYWPAVEQDFEEENPISPYNYLYSYPFIYGICGELLCFYAPPSGERAIFHYGDTMLEMWHKVADSFEEFWNSWSLLGCPEFQYECFYNKKLQKLDPFCKDAITWRQILEIEHLVNGKTESSPPPEPCDDSRRD